MILIKTTYQYIAMPGLKIIVTSIHPELKEEAISEGADEFISKNDAPAKNLEAIQKCYREEE
jgi:DNA-binding NarL/FixJ family response regulator